MGAHAAPHTHLEQCIHAALGSNQSLHNVRLELNEELQDLLRVRVCRGGGGKRIGHALRYLRVAGNS
jgi:hypothetical protein